MSETQTESVVEEPVIDTPPVENAEPTEQAEAVAEQTPEGPEQQEEKPRPNRGDRRFANLTARTATLEQELAAERRRAEAAEALLNANRTEDTPTPTRSSETVEQAADRLLAQRQMNQRLTEIDTAGRALEGWDEAKATMTSLGAVNNPAFLEALAATPDAEKVFAELAEDTDTLTALLRKTPVAMAAEMGRMAAKIEGKTTTAATGKPLSAAPRPVTPVHAPAVTPTFDPYKKGVTLDEFIAWRKKTAPARLGGSR